MQLSRVRFRIPSVQVLVHKGESFCHMTYLGLVGAQAHGDYRFAAIALLGFILVGFFVHCPEEV